MTERTSDFGALVDAGLDKLATTKILYEMHKNGAAPRWLLGTLATLSAINVTATVTAMVRQPGKSLRPTKSGKAAMAGEMLSLFFYMLAYTATADHAQHGRAAKTLRKFGKATFITSLPMALHATFRYAEIAFTRQRQ